MIITKGRQCLLILASVLLSSAVYAFEPLGTPDRDDIEYPDDEEHSAAEIDLGRHLFFDTRLSVENNQSCATCHNPDLGYGDGLVSSIGSTGAALDRNTPHIYNLAWNVTFFWDGRSDSLEHQALGPIQSGVEMGMTLDLMLKRLNNIEGYKKMFKAAYGNEVATSHAVAHALAAFERTIISDNAPYDKYVAGDKAALSPSAKRGLALYEGKARCILCHDGSNFTDNSFHNIGLGISDPGRATVVKDDSLLGAFKTPGLRNVLLTAPYMHDGSIASLEEVIEFYNKGGEDPKNRSELIEKLNLTKQDAVDLIAFLGALTSHVDVERPELP